MTPWVFSLRSYKSVSIIVSNTLRYNFYIYPLLYGTNIVTKYYFPNKRQHFFSFLYVKV